MGADVAAQREDAREVHLEHGIPVTIRELMSGVPLLYATAVEQDVDSVTIAKDLGCELGDGFVRRKVCGVDCCLAAKLLDRFFCLLVRLIPLKIVSNVLRVWQGVWFWRTWTSRMSAPASARAMAMD